MTNEAEAERLAADKIFFRTGGKHVRCFDRRYDLPWKESDQVYKFIVSALLNEAKLQGKVAYALPGSPVFLSTPQDFV